MRGYWCLDVERKKYEIALAPSDIEKASTASSPSKLKFCERETEA